MNGIAEKSERQYPMFSYCGRPIELNPKGIEFLEHTVRIMHDGLNEASVTILKLRDDLRRVDEYLLMRSGEDDQESITLWIKRNLAEQTEKYRLALLQTQKVLKDCPPSIARDGVILESVENALAAMIPGE